MSKQKAALFWSGGKDAALVYWLNSQNKHYEIECLITTVNTDDEVAMHQVPMEIIRAQAKSMEMPLLEMKIPPFSKNEVYEAAFQKTVIDARSKFGIEYLLFGDIYLEGIKEYREKLVAKSGLEAAYPLWGKDTKMLFDTLLKAKMKAITVVVDDTKLSASWLGKKLDQKFKRDYPEALDLCGEDGAYHSFVYNAPFMKKQIALPDFEQKSKTLMIGEQQQKFYFLQFKEG